MMRFPLSFSKPHRFSHAHVLLVHGLVLLTALAPTPMMADMLSTNLGHGGASAGGTTATAPVAAGGIDSAAATAQAHGHAQDMLSRNMMALDAVNAMQEAARAAAAGVNNLGANPNFAGQTLPDVPNGLVTGGLDINGAPVGANAPSQSLQNAHTIVTIQQTQQQALINWNTFNVGKDTTVKFDQSAGGTDVGTWIAFNKITDPSGNPTQILGSIEAQGQVYIINQNGIIFGGASEVNTHAMVASALPLNDNLVTRGLLNNPDSQFLFAADFQPSGSKGPTSSFTPPSVPAFGKIGDVTVQAGAQITAPTSSANVGGRVILVGPNVTNNGTISTPDGQTILAAGMDVGFVAHSSDDPSLRGLDVYVGSVGSYGGTATNAGLIEAPRGSVVIAGKEVDQNGFIDSTTSVSLNGRIDLLANYNAIANTNYDASVPSNGGPFVYQTGISTGIIRTGAGSVMQILPEWASTDQVVGTELALKSQINMQGLAVYLGANSVVLAPNANVAISAGIWDLLMISGNTNLQFATSAGQIYLDQNAVIDVAGSTAVTSPLADYILTVVLRGAELADSALQRNGSLRGSTITVDLRKEGVRSDGTVWVGTPLANLTGYLGIIEHTVGELTTAGGTVSLTAGGSVVMQQGSLVNVSSGYQDFTGGTVATTRLVADGKLIDIANADPNVVYDGIYTGSTTIADTHWGTTTTTTGIFASTSHYEDPYSSGGNGGSVQISAAAMALDGSLLGNTIIGPQQLTAAPELSSLSIQFQSQQDSRSPLNFPYFSPTPPSVQFRNGGGVQTAVGAFGLDGSGQPLALSSERMGTVILAAELLTTQGFGSLLVDNSYGSILVPADVALTTAPTGSIALRGSVLDIEGQMTAAGGQISLTAYNISPYNAAILGTQGTAAVVPAANPALGKVIVGPSARLSTAGLIIDNRAGAVAPLTIPTQVGSTSSSGAVTYASSTRGGAIKIQGYSAEIAVGSVLDVSGGLLVDSTITYGNGGSISIQAGNDPLIASLLGGHLNLGGTLLGYSGAVGATLALQAPIIQVGGAATYSNTLLLQPEFFSSGGFNKFTLTGLGVDITPPAGAQTFAPAIVIAPGTVIQPVVSSLTAQLGTAGGPDAITLTTLTQPEGYRTAVTLDFEAPGVLDFVSGLLDVRGNIVVRAGAQIATDALGSITLHGQTIEMLGEIDAPGGVVTLKGAGHYPDNTSPVTAFATVHLGTASRVSTAGKTVLLNDVYNRRVGTVYAGGTIDIEGNIVADAGAVLDVSGTSSVLDLLASEAGQGLAAARNAITQMVQAASTVPVSVDSNGGSITLKGSEFLYSSATLRGNAGGATAQGGSLTVSSGIFIVPGGGSDDKDINLLVAQDITAFTQPFFAAGQGVVGKSLVSGGGAAIKGEGYFGANSFLNGGFDSLTLAGNTQFKGAVDLTARGSLTVAVGGVLAADSLVRLTAPYVALGRPLMNPTRDEELLDPFNSTLSGTKTFSQFSPTFGTGRLEVTADLIEAGFLSLQNIGQASLTARQDLRGNGYLDMAGSLTITAGQVYPVTASTFTITAYNYTSGTGSVTLISSGQTPEFPLSGGGRLSIYASTITQGGTLRAPFGSITLGWDGTGTAPIGLVTNVSVPVTQQITLGTGSVTSVSAIDPTTGAGVSIPYGLVKDGTNWIDPTGQDITSIGVPDKTIRVSALNVTTQAGSSVDIRGGGELYGYRWVTGNGGTEDILASSDSFAIIPGYTAAFSPFAPYATTGLNVANLGGDKGYANGSLKVGDQIYLKDSTLVAGGAYTLLPARYALLPGAFLITPSSGTPTDSLVKPGGAALANGYLFNGLNPAAAGTVYQQFEIAPQSVVQARAEYTNYSAAVFIPAAQQSLSLPVSLTPMDAGYALFGAQQTMDLAGNVSAAGALTGRGGRVDISSPLEIILAAGAPDQAGKLVLDTSLLSGWNAESLLIGGQRTFGTSSDTVTVRTNQVTLNAGVSMNGKEIILAANQTVTLAAGASITQTGTQAAADALVINGNGSLVRVSGVTSAQTSRTGVTTSALPQLSVGAGVKISGASITLDSSNVTALNTSASLVSQAINLSSGRVSLQLTNPGSLQTTGSLVLGGTALASLQNTTALSLLSYTSIDLYGTGTFANTGTLALHAGEIRGFNNLGGAVNLTAQSILLDNSANGTVGTVGTMSGTLSLTGATITIGQNALVVNQFTTVTLNASGGILMQGTGSFSSQGDLNAVTPFFTAASNATQNFTAGGVLNLSLPAGPPSLPTTLGLGAQLTFTGASITDNTNVFLPSGLISLHALTGDLVVGGRLDAGGATQSFFDVVRYTDAGKITLTADAGNVTLAGASVASVAAAGSGNAGTLVVGATNGLLTMSGTLLGQASTGNTGSATIDVRSIASYTTLNNTLNAGSFTNVQNLRVRTGSVSIDGTVNAHQFTLSVDQGSITVNTTGFINAAAHQNTLVNLPAGFINANAAVQTGGVINLIANGDVVVKTGAVLTVAAQNFDDAGKGGSISLESGAEINGVVGPGFVDLQTGSTLNLSVASKIAGGATTPGTSAFLGQFSGTLNIRAPQTATFNNIQVKPINATIIDPSSITIEGYRLYSFNQANVILRAGTTAISGETLTTTTLQTNANTFFGTSNVNYNSMFASLLANNASLQGVTVIVPGIEIINRGGSISLGTASSPVANDWDLGVAAWRFGPKSAPGVLTMRASGNLSFFNALSDGFNAASTANTSTNAVEKLWTAPLMTLSTTLPVNVQSWSFRMASGADLSSANFRAVLPIAQLATNSGSVQIGKNDFQALPSSPSSGDNALTRRAINLSGGTNVATTTNFFQVIRTGTGSIDIYSGRDVQLLNQFATIYTAGVQVASTTTVFTAGDFVAPILTPTNVNNTPNQLGLGIVQQLYPAQYSRAGGNVTVSAGNDIVHLTKDSQGNLIMDSQRELPNNWLMRRSYVDPTTGLYGSTGVTDTVTKKITDSAASTTWWIDFSNFFDGIAALGGGNVTLNAGRDVQNVSAHAPTNARAATGTPSAATLLELGGGDVVVQAGRNIDGGIYYVERGTGTLQAGGSITTNSTRAPGLGQLITLPSGTPDLTQAAYQNTWLPTTLFVGKSNFKVSARGDLLLGPVANTTLLPQGLNNKHWYKTYFSTYSQTSSVSVTSLGGNITLREEATTPFASGPESLLGLWMKNELLYTGNSAANYQPWLRLVETNIDPFQTLISLMPGNLHVTAYTGNVNVVGNINLAPSATGSLEILAGGAFNGLQPTGLSQSIIPGKQTTVWASSSINLSDASPSSIPGVLTPYAYFSVVGNNNTAARQTNSTFLQVISAKFAESGSTTGNYASTQTKQALHAQGLLHAADYSPVLVYAGGGDISGLTLFSGKSAQILAERDITDIALYIQNVRSADVSVVASGRDIVAYNASSILRSLAVSSGNLTASSETPKSGDIQISGPGTLQVLAGRNLNLGTGSNNSDGTGVGITSIGNGRNPYLPFAGASVIVGAGMGAAAAGVGGSISDFADFINYITTSAAGARYLAELADLLGVASVNLNDPTLTADQQKQLALAVFYLALRDAGRDHNDPDSPNAGTYAEAYAAIAKLFPSTYGGSIQTQARDIRTKSGGNISILAPAGGLALASTTIGSTLAPPGIITEAGGSISIFADNSVNIGISRIFTLKGGDIIIWSSTGDIAAGSSSKTVQSAPPTRVLIDPQSANVATDLAGLATGGGIGVLATVAGVRPGNVDLIAPIGAVDAGDAGIRATGNLNIAATIVLNAANIAVGGTSGGTPAAATVAAPSLGGVAAAASAGAATTGSNAPAPAQSQPTQVAAQDQPSLITVEVLGYGGGGGDDLKRGNDQPGE